MTEQSMENVREGHILKGIGGFYYVETPERVYECRARGLFRKDGITPLAGDRVFVSVLPDGTGTVEEILPRRNFLERPPVANLDTLVIVASVREPHPNTLMIDRMIAQAVFCGIEPVLVISKTDLESAGPLSEIYRKAGVLFFSVSAVTGEGVEELEKILTGKTTVFTGNSGVGKSTLLNSMFRSFHLQTGEISKKLGRGRHTTRQVELLKLEGGGYVADTPGFSSFDSRSFAEIRKEDLAGCFSDFAPYVGQCRFTSCTHTCEEGCAVIEAVRRGDVSGSRHESYVSMYREMKEKKEWNKKEKSAW